MENPKSISASHLPDFLSRRILLKAGLAHGLVAASSLGLASNPAYAQIPDSLAKHPYFFDLLGNFSQGGYGIGKAYPNTNIFQDGKLRGKTSKLGYFYLGFDRDAPSSTLIEMRDSDATLRTLKLDIAPTKFDVQEVNGLPQDTVTPTDPKLLARIKRESAIKAKGFASQIDEDWFKDGFVYPLKQFRVSGHFGNQRILNGTPKSPHYGFDMAAPSGTQIFAPQKGLVTLAEPDLFYEGGLTLIDHGQGLISMYLHQSKILVKKGDIVKQGQNIGLVGSKGRATGPHLCWRLKWQKNHMDASLMVRIA